MGILHKIVSDMCYWVMTVSRTVVSRNSVEHVTRDDMLDLTTVVRINRFDKALEERLNGTNLTNEEASDMCIDNIDEADKAAHGDGSNTPSDDEYAEMLPEDRPDCDDLDVDAYDKYIGAEVLMDVKGEGSRWDTVKRRVRNDDGTVVGTNHQNPLMDTREYELEYNNGTHNRYFANVIEDNLYSHINLKGLHLLVLEEISDHRNDGTALEVSDGYTVVHNGNRTPKKTTCRWKLWRQNERGLHHMGTTERPEGE